MKRINVLIFGSGGREHALAWKLMQSPQAGTIYVMPGNPGTAMMGCQNVPIEPISANLEIIRAFVKNREIGLIVIQLDNALAEGLVNNLQDLDVVIFGPTRSAAQIEWSKSYAKEIMAAAGIPTAPFKIFKNVEMVSAVQYVKDCNRPLVVKADGLALGKGVRVCNDRDTAIEAIEDCFLRRKFGAAGHTIVIEDKLEGVELSVHAFCDGDNAIMLPPLRDHKRLSENDPDSPMTGGMGVYGPIDIDGELHRKIVHDIIEPCLHELQRRGTPFRGCLYPGIMLTEYGPKVLEFNARFGDPETQVYMRLLSEDIDLIDVFMKCAEGRLLNADIAWRSCKAACIIAAAAGYPDNPRKGDLVILNLPYDGEYDPIAFHAGTAWKKGALVTNDGRVLGVTTLIPKDKDMSWAYEPFGRAKVCFKDMQYRKDIGAVS